MTLMDFLHIGLAASLAVLSILIIRIAVDDDYRIRSFYNDTGRTQNFIASALTYAFEAAHQLTVPFAMHHWVHGALVACTIAMATMTSVQIVWRVHLSNLAEARNVGR